MIADGVDMPGMDVLRPRLQNRPGFADEIDQALFAAAADRIGAALARLISPLIDPGGA
jgi:hypothetical protein